MNDAVRGSNIGRSDRCGAHHDGSVVDGEGRVVAVGHGGGHAVGHVRSRDGTCNDVVQQDVRKGGVGLVVVKGGEVDAGGFESGVRWCEDRERSFALKGRHQLGVSESSHEGPVDARSGGHAGDVFERRLLDRWDEYLVDDVNDAVAGSDAGGGTVASLIITVPLSTVNVALSPLAIVATKPSLTLAASTAPSST